ncbi:MAG: cupin domain-containing protein [Casimicrobiaceae bacterium]
MQTRIYGATQGREMDVLGNRLLEKASSEDLGGGAAVFVQTVESRSGPPAHIHHDADEFFFMLEGELDVWIGGDYARLRPGMSAVLPRGVVHRFHNPGRRPVKVLVVVSPGIGARFFDELHEARPRLPEELHRVAEILGRHDIELFNAMA